jgi:hypothetical protein
LLQTEINTTIYTLAAANAATQTVHLRLWWRNIRVHALILLQLIFLLVQVLEVDAPEELFVGVGVIH